MSIRSVYSPHHHTNRRLDMHAILTHRRHRPPIRAVALVLLGVVGSTGCSTDASEYRPTAATAPSTDIYLATLEYDDGTPSVGEAVNITDREGYDNQPHFLPDGSAILYTSARDTIQTDIFRYDVATGSITRVTSTDNASEFSATVLPNGEGFSTIHEDAQSQQLWSWDLDGSDHGGLLDDMQPVGYHAWADGNLVAAFVLGDSATPATLRLADRNTGEEQIVLENPGRSLHRVPESNIISFVHKVSDTEWLIKTLDPVTQAIGTLTATLPGREDYAWLPDGSIVMGDGSALFRWAGRQWSEIADLSQYGVSDISRLAVDPLGQRIAVVGNRDP